MRYRLLAVMFVLTTVSHAQDNQPKSFHFSIGPALNVTPIYLKQVANVTIHPAASVLQQDDQHYSGWGLWYSLEKELNENLSFVFNQQFRYDFLYMPLPFSFQFRDPTYPLRDKWVFTTDIGADINRVFSTGRSSVKIGLGVGVSGLGSKFDFTEAYTLPNGQVVFVTISQDYIYPFLSFVSSWTRKNLKTSLRMNYCPRNPGSFREPFLQPQLGLQYRLFSF